MSGLVLLCDVIPDGNAKESVLAELRRLSGRGTSVTVVCLGPDRWRSRRRAAREPFDVHDVHDGAAGHRARSLVSTRLMRLRSRPDTRWADADESSRRSTVASIVPPALEKKVKAPRSERATARETRRADGSVAIRERLSPGGTVYQRDFVRPDGFAYLTEMVAGTGEGLDAFAFDHSASSVTRYPNGARHWEAEQVRQIVGAARPVLATLGERSAAVGALLAADCREVVDLSGDADPSGRVVALAGDADNDGGRA